MPQSHNANIPFELGYRMPPEWEKHEATWLSWPKDPLTFPDEIVGRVEQTYVEIIEALRTGERVELLVDDEKTRDHVKSLLRSTDNVRFHLVKTADVWMRDYGPIFVKNRIGEVAATKWVFNAWGGKYDELLKDNDSGFEVCKLSGVKEIFEPGIVLEGGSIETNGQGSCLTTRQCLLNKNRNPQLSKEEIEEYLHDYLGFENMIWLGEGIEGDDTDGHVDDIARFVGEKSIICMVEEDKNSKNHVPLEKNYETLLKNYGADFKIAPIKMPQRIDDAEGNALPASYANFYIGNEFVLVPVFGVENDHDALRVISGLFPNRKTLGINCRELVYGFGGIHCVTQQQPSQAST